MSTVRIKASLIDHPDCWREIEVPKSVSLATLARGIVNSFGFSFDHAFGFYSDLGDYYQGSRTRYEFFADMDDADDWPPEPGMSPAGSVKKSKVGKVFTAIGQRMQFIFDYGDEWRFLVETTGFGERVSGRRYPLVLDLRGTPPEQYPDED